MRTVGRHRPKSSPKGDYLTFCSYCGTAYLRSQLYVDSTGLFVCPDEGVGLDVIATEQANLDMTRVFERSDHDAPEDPLSTDTAPDLNALCGGTPTGGDFS